MFLTMFFLLISPTFLASLFGVSEFSDWGQQLSLGKGEDTFFKFTVTILDDVDVDADRGSLSSS